MMSRSFADIAFTPAVQERQTHYGSRDQYARMQSSGRGETVLGAPEEDFIAAADSFYLATVGETGWPYVQHRGGPRGFLQVLARGTPSSAAPPVDAMLPVRLAYADFRGNRQYISAGNVSRDDRVSIIIVDYELRRRLKLLGHLRFVDVAEADPELVRQVTMRGYSARIERVALIDVVAFDWNCPQHITQRFTLERIEELHQPLLDRIAELEAGRVEN